MSKIIFHLHRNFDIALPHRNLDGGEFWRAKGDFGVTRKAKAFARDEDRLIKPTIRVFIMNKADRVIARCQSLYGYRPDLVGKHAKQPGILTALTVRKARGVGSKANEDDPLA